MEKVTAGWSADDRRSLKLMVDSGSMMEAMMDEFSLSKADLKRAIEEVSQHPTKKVVKPSAGRTSAGLRDVLFDTIDDLRCGVIEPAQAKAVAQLSQAICETVALEIQAVKLRPENSRTGLSPLMLGEHED